MALQSETEKEKELASVCGEEEDDEDEADEPRNRTFRSEDDQITRPLVTRQASTVPKVQFLEDNRIKNSEKEEEDKSEILVKPTTSPSKLHQLAASSTSAVCKSIVKRKRTLSDTSFFSNSAHSGSLLSRTSSSSSSNSYTFVAPDGGWGWVIVMASFLVNMIADGVTFSFGVLLLELQNEFEESKAMTAGVVSLFHAVPLLSGPIASALTDRYGCRKMTILGSILAAIGFLLSVFCYRLEYLFVTFGLISGFGLSLCYVSAIVIVAYYFDRRRSFATGISLCGSGVGTFLFAPFTQFLIDFYGGWRGACMILAGIFLNMVVCGMLFRDLEWTRNRSRKFGQNLKRPSFTGSQSSSNYSNLRNASMPEVEELKAILESGDITDLFSNEETEIDFNQRTSSSLMNIPTFIAHGGDRLPDEVVEVLSRNKQVCDLLLQRFHESPAVVGLINDSVTKNNSTNPELEEPIEVKLKRKVSSLFKKKPNGSVLKKPATSAAAAAAGEDDDNLDDDNGDNISIDEPNNHHTRFEPHHGSVFGHEHRNHKMNLHHLRVRRQSLTYRGAMLNINKYRLRASSCPDIYRNSMSTLNREELSEARSIFGCFLGLKSFLFECCRYDFLNLRFSLFCLSNFILYAWYDVMYVYLMDYSEKDLHFPSSDATMLISVIGILNTVGEVVIGFLGDCSWMNLNLLYAVCMLACGLVTAVVPFITRFGFLATLAGIYGFAISANYSLTSPILVELVSLEQFSNAYGVLLLAQGISNLIGPPFAGYLYDVTQEWYLSFGLAGIFILLSGVLLLILPCLKRAKRRKIQRNCEEGVVAESFQ